MPVFVTCPACGCRVQMAEGMIGQRTRCIACNERFVADPTVQPPPPPPRRPPLPRAPTSPSPSAGMPFPPRGEDEEPSPDGRPYCPGCGRRVNWDWLVCYHCGEPFDYDEMRPGERGQSKRPRRDTLPHRGAMLANLGNVTLAVGALTLCMGVGAVVTVPLGIATIIMATTDLNQMRHGLMDTAGRAQTENSRTAAVTGLALSLIFSAGWILLYLTRV